MRSDGRELCFPPFRDENAEGWGTQVFPRLKGGKWGTHMVEMGSSFPTHDAMKLRHGWGTHSVHRIEERSGWRWDLRSI